MVSERRVRLRDIADVAGVTPSTVSRVLNRAPEAARIPQSTRDRVERIAAEMNYVPDQSARGLRTGRGFLVPLLVPDLAAEMVGVFFRSVARTLSRSGLSVIMGESATFGSEALRQLSVGALAGLIIVGDVELTTELREVRVMPTTAQRDAATGPVIMTDNPGGAVQAADHLLGLGHRSLAMISFMGLQDVAERCTFAVRVADRGADIEVIEAGSLGIGAGRAVMAELMSRPAPPTAVFAATDTLALGALLWCLESGVSVPAQVSIVGFDDVPLTGALQPGLTTVRQPMEAMAVAAADALVALIDDGSAAGPAGSGTGTGSRVTVLPTELIVRGSTGPPRPTGPVCAR